MFSDWYDSYDSYSCNPNEWVDRDDHDDDELESPVSDYEVETYDYEDY